MNNLSLEFTQSTPLSLYTLLTEKEKTSFLLQFQVFQSKSLSFCFAKMNRIRVHGKGFSNLLNRQLFAIQ